MNVSICVGEGASEKIISAISGMLDDVVFSTYPSLGSLAKDIQLKHTDMRRVIFTGKIIKNAKKELKEFHVFLKKKSPKTEVVLICNQNDVNDIGDVFKKVFNSPIYTVVVPTSSNASLFKDLVKSPIAEISKKYSLGGNQNSAEISDDNNSDPTGSSMGSNGVISGSESGEEAPATSSAVYSRYRGTAGSSWGSSNIDSGEISSESYQSAGFSEEVGFSGEDFSDEDEDLSVSAFGSAHSDTGFIDGDDDDIEVDDEAVETEEVDERLVHESTIVNKVNEGYRKESSIAASLNIDLVISTRENRVTQEMIDEAMKLYRDDNGKILIIDLDYRENSILSYLRTGDFYRGSYQEGIKKQRLYEEDHVTVCSNGYGVPIMNKDLKALLSSRQVREFELILIDCPVDCLNILDEELINMCHVLIHSGGTRRDMVSMSLGLTNRSIVRLGVEKYIMRNCEVEIAGELIKPDLAYMKKYTLFANGTWLDKVQ